MAKVAVVIPTWNGQRLLPIALDSLRGQQFRDFEVIVVDNGSVDGTVDWLQREYPEVRLLVLPENRGFAAAANAGIAATDGRYVALLNNDAEADPEWLQALVRTLDELPEAGAAASRVLQRRDPARIDSAGDTLGVLAYSIGHDDVDGPLYDHPRWVPSACAAAALYRREALREVGPLDERFFAYLEDVDLGLRLLLAGWKTRYVPDAVARHEGSATAQRMGSFKLHLLLLNSLRLFVQYAPWRRLVFGPLLLLWVVVRGVRERRPGTALLALAAFARDLPVAVGRRIAHFRSRRISRRAFCETLGPALMRGSPRHPIQPAESTKPGSADTSDSAEAPL